MSPSIRTSTLMSVFLGLFATASIAADLPETTHDGLQLVPGSKVRALYAEPGASLAAYKRIALLDCYVAFKKDWQRDQNSSGLRVSSADMQRIRTGVAEMFREAFTKELQDGGYQMTTEGGEDVLILRPAIINLDVSAPDTMSAGMGRTFSTSAGSMTLFVEFLDGATGEILLRAVDAAAARDSGRMMWQSSVTNKAEADRMFGKWAKLARDGLDRARASGAAIIPAPQK